MLFQPRHMFDDAVDAGVAHIGAVKRRLGAEHAFERAAARGDDEELLRRLGKFGEGRKRLFHAVGADIDHRVIDVDDLVEIVIDRLGVRLALQFFFRHPRVLRRGQYDIVGFDQILQADFAFRIAGGVEMGAFHQHLGIGGGHRRSAGDDENAGVLILDRFRQRFEPWVGDVIGHRKADDIRPHAGELAGQYNVRGVGRRQVEVQNLDRAEIAGIALEVGGER